MNTPAKNNIANDLTELVGKTPLIRLKSLLPDASFELLGKLEFFNPGGSVKDRIGLNMILMAEKEGLIKKDTLIVEPTSGNTGIALAWVCSVKGYSLVLTMPDSMSRERTLLLKALGAKIVLTPAHLGMTGSIEKAQELLKKNPNSFMPQQFKNPHNPEVHYKTTGPEIWRDSGEKLDIFVVGVGTGGTLSGAGKYLKEKNPDLKIIAVEPKDSAVLSGKACGPHMIQGIGAGFVPDILDRDLIDEIFLVKNEDALKTASSLASKAGILCGISSGANVFASQEIGKRKESEGKTILTMICDTGERYLSTALYRS